MKGAVFPAALALALASSFACKALDTTSAKAIREVSLGSQNLPSRLQLPVAELRSSFEPHASYCRRSSNHCDLSGPQIIAFDSNTFHLLKMVNIDTNRTVQDTSDMELYGLEEYWAFPSHGKGDCEDIALFKREQLVRHGLPRAAMTIALVHHKKEMFPHAVLLIETTAGTYLLDNLMTDVVIWHEARYNFEARERQDGTWERYDQSNWVYE